MKKHALLIILILLFGFLFFYRLDWNTLVSWDEAWYGTIARNMLKSGDWMRMVWKGQAYFDHPPMGFWLMAISYKIFGINEFSTRLPSALLGLFSILLIYKTGIELFGKKIIGFAAGLVLGTSAWYIVRVRSGNLDSLFVFFYILTVYLSFKSSKNFRLFPLTMAAFGGLILSKTLVGFSAAILIFYWNFTKIFQSRKNFTMFLLGLLTTALIVLPWYYINNKENIYFIQQHFINIGIRKRTSIFDYLRLDYKLPLFYLHMGVRKWYYLWLVATAFLAITFKFLKKQFFFLFLWNTIILYPFLTTSQTQIWHLIPVYLPMALLIAVGFYYGIESGYKVFRHSGLPRIRFWSHRFALPQNDSIVNMVYVLFFVIIAFIQIKIFYPEFYPNGHYIPDDVRISKSAAKYNQQIFLDDDFFPIATFYSGKDMKPLIDLPDKERTMVGFFQSDKKDFIVITRNWAVDNLKAAKIPYKILEKNNSFSIVSRP